MVRTPREEHHRIAEKLVKESDIDDERFSGRRWTEEETEALHDLVREYLFARALRKRVARYLALGLGLPAAILAFWDPVERIIKLVSRKLQ